MDIILDFKPTERDVLVHRLEASEAIAEAVSDESDLDYGIALSEARWLAREIAKGNPIKTSLRRRHLNAVLRDAIEGATLLSLAEDAAAAGQITEGRLARLRVAACSVARKLRAAGIECKDAPGAKG